MENTIEKKNGSLEYVPRFMDDREPAAEPETAPAVSDYECDILVIGGGFSGLMAAVTAAEQGNRVVLVDKGKPGYSGQTPYAGCTSWFDPELGDDREAYENNFMRGSQYMGNYNWGQVWLEESKSTYLKMKELGLFEEIPRAVETGHADALDYVGYREFTGAKDRHARFVPILKKKGVTVVTHTMITCVTRNEEKATGAIGFHVPSGCVIAFHAKAVIMCMGGGTYKPAGWPACSISYDAAAIGYELGLPIIGHEFEDYHFSSSGRPSNAFIPNVWDYLEPMCFLGGMIKKDHLFSTFKNNSLKWKTALEGHAAWGDTDHEQKAPPRKPGPGNGPRVPRLMPEETEPAPDAFGGSAGLGVHTVNGIYCGSEDTHGYTGIPGLYCAGDGCNAGPFGGSDYPGGPGFTSNFVSLQGRRAALAASEYAAGAPLCRIPRDEIEARTEELYRPLKRTSGFSPSWALDCLHAIMILPSTIVLKNEACLQGALAQVEFLRDHILPKVQAVSTHDLRTCHELKSKVLEAEMKLRASLARKESRGGHYRIDYPCRNDRDFLCFFGMVKGEDGRMNVVRIEYPDTWKGNREESYEERYGLFVFPGEKEALEKMRAGSFAAETEPGSVEGGEKA